MCQDVLFTMLSFPNEEGEKVSLFTLGAFARRLSIHTSMATGLLNSKSKLYAFYQVETIFSTYFGGWLLNIPNA
jgi:hypothetical protein